MPQNYQEHLIGRGGKSARHIRHLLYFSVLFPLVHQAHGYFLGNSKAFIQGCSDQWRLQAHVRVPVLSSLTVCVDVRVLTAGKWTAFSYMSPRWQSYDLVLQGEDGAVHAWLLGVQHRFSVHLPPLSWHRLCLLRNSPADSFRLEVNGSAATLETTVIAGPTPAGGILLLGCQPWETKPMDTAATVELYMFRMWGDVRRHGPCEDGTVASWDSALWSISHAQALVQDDTLPCGMSNLHARIKRSNSNSHSTEANANIATAANSSAPTSPTTPASSTKAVQSSSYTSLSPHVQMSPAVSQDHPNVTTSSQIQQNSSAPSPTTASRLSQLHNSSSFTTGVQSKSTTTASAQSAVASVHDRPTSSLEPLLLYPTSETSQRRESSLTTLLQTIKTSGFLQAATPNAVITEPALTAQCNFSQFCGNTTSHYWMLVTVEVLPGASKTMQDIQAWFSDVFSECALRTMQAADAYSNETSEKSCQNNSTGKFQTINVDCEVVMDFNKTNCSVLLGWSQHADTCYISQLLQHSRDHSVSAQLLGEVQRVGKDLCQDKLVMPPGGGFVYCKSSTPYQEVCNGDVPVNITCSYEKSFIPQGLAEEGMQSCSNQEQQGCDCGAFCKSSGAFYAFNLNISRPNATFTDIKDIITRLDSPCNRTIIPESLCNNISMVFDQYQGVHIQCYGNKTRMYSCMVALQLSQKLDACTVGGALAALLQSDSSVTFDGTLTRIALCGSPNASMADLLNSTFTWVTADLGAQNICQNSDFRSLPSQFTCGMGQVVSVLLNESCTVPPFLSTPTMTTATRTDSPSQASSTPVTSSHARTQPSISSTQYNTLSPGVKGPESSPVDPPLNSTLAPSSAGHFADIIDTSRTSRAITHTPLYTSASTAVVPNASHARTGLQSASAQVKTAQSNDTLLTVSLSNTIMFNTTTQAQNTLYLNTTTPLSNNSATTLSQNIPHSNVTLLHINSTLTNLTFTNSILTTLQPLHTVQYNTTASLNATTSTNTMQPKTIFTQSNTNTMPFYNVTELNISVANTTHINTTRPPFYTANLILDSTPNTTMNQLNSTKFNLTTAVNDFRRNTTELGTPSARANITQFNASVALNVTTPGVGSFIQNSTNKNTSLLPLNITERNTTFTALNTTLIDSTGSRNTTASGLNVSFSSTEFNNTTPVPDTTQTNSSSPPKTAIHFTSEASNITSNTTTLNITSIGAAKQEGSLPFNMTSRPLASTSNSSSTTSRPEAITENLLGATGQTQISPQSVLANTTVSTTSTMSPSRGSFLPVQNPVNSTSSGTTTVPVTMTTMSPELIANQLVNLTKDMALLNSSQVVEVVRDIEGLLSVPNVTVSLATTILNVINNLLNSSTTILSSLSNRLVHAVDALGMKLEFQGKTEKISLELITLVVTKIDGTSFPGITFSMMDSTNPVIKSRRRRAVNSLPLASAILPASVMDSVSPDMRPNVSRIFFTFFQKTTLFNDTNSKLQLLTPVVGMSVANMSIKGLKQNLEITMLNKESLTGNVSCVFWDFGRNGGLGGWNQSGCFVVWNASTANKTVCSCNHMTSFAVLMDFSRDEITDRAQDTALTFITFIGCGISSIFLSITLLSYLGFEKIRGDIPPKILINLCFALLLLNLVFLLDSWLSLYTDAVGLCISTAFFLHYFLLASFTWMGLEALHLYLAIVKVFNNTMSRYMLKFTLIGWGIPLVVVTIVIAVDKNNYGLITYGKFADNTTDDFCWLKSSIAFYVGVVAYFCVIFVANMATFVMVMVQLRRIKRQNPHNSQYRSNVQDLRSVAGLTMLLGLTWGFAFFAWGPVKIAFMYLFCIFNTLQGFFIFVFHCAVKENVRRQWRTYLCCGKLRLAENSDWSRTATNTKKTSLPTSTHGSQTHSTSRSSSLTTSSTPSSMLNSPVEEIMFAGLDDPSDDVVLNDIYSQDRSLYRPE